MEVPAAALWGCLGLEKIREARTQQDHERNCPALQATWYSTFEGTYHSYCDPVVSRTPRATLPKLGPFATLRP